MILLGPTIYSLILLRPEIVILTVAILIYFWGSKINSHSNFSIIFGGLLVTFAYSLALYMHPKSVYLAPALTCAQILRAQGLNSKTAQLCFMGISFILCGSLVFSAIGMHKLQLLSCTAYPSLQETMTNQAVNLLQVFNNSQLFFAKLHEAFSPGLWASTLEKVSYWYKYDADYLPGTKYDLELLRTLQYVIGTILMVFLLVTLIILLRIIFTKKGTHTFWTAILLALVCMGLTFPIVMNLRHHFYDVSFLTGSIIIITCLAWPLCTRNFNTSYKFSLKLVYILISSGIIFLGVFGLTMLKDFDEKFHLGYEGPSIAIGKLHTQKDIASFIGKSLEDKGISHQAPLVIDDLTYDFVMNYPHIHPITYLFVNQDVARDMPAIIKKNNIHYGVTRCSSSQLLKLIPTFIILETVKFQAIDDICIFSI